MKIYKIKNILNNEKLVRKQTFCLIAMESFTNNIIPTINASIVYSGNRSASDEVPLLGILPHESYFK